MNFIYEKPTFDVISNDEDTEVAGSELGYEALEKTDETYFAIREILQNGGYSEFKNVNDVFKTLPDTSIIVRREDPRRIFELLSEANEYKIGFENDDERYSNCVEWNFKRDGSANIHNAYMEGFSDLNNVVAVVGFEQASDDDILKLPDAQQNFYGLQRDKVRSFKGTVNQEKIKFVNLRIPAHLLPENELTETELDRLHTFIEAKKNNDRVEPIMIHRSFMFTDSAGEIKKAA